MRSVITVKQAVPIARLEALLCDALEGGSNYWYMIQDVKEPREWTNFGTGSENWNKDKTKFQYLYPFNRGGALMIDDECADEPELKEPVCLNFERVEWGVQKWSEDAQNTDEKTRTAHPHHWNDMMSESGDATTADVFLQYCIFGRVIYG